jgi:hypothetical protein
LARYSDREIIEELLHNDARLQKRVKWFYKNNRKEIRQYITANGGTSKQAAQVMEDGMVALFHYIKNTSVKSSLSQTYVRLCQAIWQKSEGWQNHFYPPLHEERAMEKLFARMDDSDVQVLKAFYYEAKSEEQITRQFGRPAHELEDEKKWSALRQLKDLLQKDEDLLNELNTHLEQ